MAIPPIRPRTRFSCSAVTLLVLLFSLSGCLTTTPDQAADLLPPISNQATGIWQPGRIVWLDLVTPDAPAARKFYGGLFGWTFKSDGNYTVISNGPQQIGGIIEIRPEKGKKAVAQWLASMSVADVDKAADWTKKSGGKVLNGPLAMHRRGYGALIEGPEGARLVILKPQGGDPPEKEPGLGEWLWLEDWTTRLDQSIAFYRQLGSYEQVLQENDYAVLINGGKWRAGIRQIREKAFSGRWVPAVRVKDAKQLLPRVKALGGRVWLAPGQAESNPDTALISDNTGALLILQPWDFGPAEEKKP